MKISKIKKNLLLIALFCICAFTGCTKSNVPPSAEQQNIASLVALTNANGEVMTDSDAVEQPGGNIDYTVYEQYGLIYDKESNCYTYNGDVVRFFNDPVAGASFTNFFTGTVDIEAERDIDNKLIGIKECSEDVYNWHEEKYRNSGLASMPTDTSMEVGSEIENRSLLQEYEPYGISYNIDDGHWQYNEQRIGLVIDSEKSVVYLNETGSVYLSVSRNDKQEILDIKEISETDAQTLLKNNNPSNSTSFATEEN